MESENRIERWLGRRLSPLQRGVFTSVAAIVFLGLCLWAPLAILAERPTAELLRYMAAIGATLLIAYAIETSAVVRADYIRTAQRESWIGFVVGCSCCGLAAIMVSLGLGERAEAGHWSWVDTGALGFCFASLFILGLVVALLPAMHYEWRRALHVDPPDDD